MAGDGGEVERGRALRVGGVGVGAGAEEGGGGRVVALGGGEMEGRAAVHGLGLGLRAPGEEDGGDVRGVDVGCIVQGRAAGLDEGGVRVGAGGEEGLGRARLADARGEMERHHPGGVRGAGEGGGLLEDGVQEGGVAGLDGGEDDLGAVGDAGRGGEGGGEDEGGGKKGGQVLHGAFILPLPAARVKRKVRPRAGAGYRRRREQEPSGERRTRLFISRAMRSGPTR